MSIVRIIIFIWLAGMPLMMGALLWPTEGVPSLGEVFRSQVEEYGLSVAIFGVVVALGLMVVGWPITLYALTKTDCGVDNEEGRS